ncbi:MAG: NAD(P)/FAD-dependent oxidoreductase [Firmicutes bacterium]|nr:NAD(P)/FAD-dependent oxidoreductase [Bacillota bacterium]
MSLYDCAVVGTGPGGLSAAVTLKLRQKNVILLGTNKLSDKVQKASKIENYLGLPSVSGKDLYTAFKSHIDAMGISVTEDRVTAVYSLGDKFSLQGASGNIYEAKTVIIATGVSPLKTLKGEEELLGMGVSYCATCDAPLYKGKDVAVIAYSKDEEEEVNYLAEVAQNVYFYPQYKEVGIMRENVVISEGEPKEICPASLKTKKVVTDKGEREVSGVFILRQSVAPAQLIPGIETEGGFIKTDKKMQTNIKGLFACGDVTGQPHQYIKAAGEGNVAALSAVKFI